MNDNLGTAIPTRCTKCGADCADAHGWIGNQAFCVNCYNQTSWPECVTIVTVQLERKLAEAREIMQDCIENKALAEHQLVELKTKLAASEQENAMLREQLALAAQRKTDKFTSDYVWSCDLTDASSGHYTCVLCGREGETRGPQFPHKITCALADEIAGGPKDGPERRQHG